VAGISFTANCWFSELDAPRREIFCMDSNIRTRICSQKFSLSRRNIPQRKHRQVGNELTGRNLCKSDRLEIQICGAIGQVLFWNGW